MRKALILTISALGILTQANAVQMHFDGMEKNQYEDVHIQYKGNDMDVHSGPQDIHFGDDTKDEQKAYCIDLEHKNTGGDTYDVTIKTKDDVEHSDMVCELFNAYCDEVNDPIKGCAFQLALWDCVTDGGDGFDKGDFKCNSMSKEVYDQAEYYLNNYMKDGKNEGEHCVLRSDSHPNGEYQDLYTCCPVPEPGSILAIGLGVAGLIRRRKSA
jgi:hypothetical protein